MENFYAELYRYRIKRKNEGCSDSAKVAKAFFVAIAPNFMPSERNPSYCAQNESNRYLFIDSAQNGSDKYIFNHCANKFGIPSRKHVFGRHTQLLEQNQWLDEYYLIHILA